MTGRGKFVALIAGILILLMPAAAMPLHCVLMSPAGSNADHCHMAGMSSPENQSIGASPADHSCCQGPAAKTESVSLPRTSYESGIVAPSVDALLASLPSVPATRKQLDREMRLPDSPQLAVLCTFLI